jgi:hypothetical protein
MKLMEFFFNVIILLLYTNALKKSFVIEFLMNV